MTHDLTGIYGLAVLLYGTLFTVEYILWKIKRDETDGKDQRP